MSTNEASPVEMPCVFTDAREAHSLHEAQLLAVAERNAEIAAFVIRKVDWENISREAELDNPATAILATALGNTVLKRNTRYSFSGRQPCAAHVDEVPEDLLDLAHQGRFNEHKVVIGAVTACMVYTRPGYYIQDMHNRIPNTAYNPGITHDLMRQKLINTYTTDTRIIEAELGIGDRIIFFERASATVDGYPNVVHLFHRGTSDRLSIINQYYAHSI